ncbi:hypothetical protein CDAR_67811 [Caerostris darwini]|uniref:Uncharacterized protein n=1 Tax=Caerostris darwini TaxID=1538125 RepID=A0AAV4WG13_9ARAC|nr:hypothetical protein CDAR_67811 [Caerostris darwini]
MKLQVPDVDRARSYPRNLLAVILEVQKEDFHTCIPEISLQSVNNNLLCLTMLQIKQSHFENVLGNLLLLEGRDISDAFARDNASLINANVKIPTNFAILHALTV